MAQGWDNPKDKSNRDSDDGQAANPLNTLTLAQAKAIDHVRAVAMRTRSHELEMVEEICAKSGVPPVKMEAAISSIRDHARVTINFHPDRVLPTGLTVVEGLLREGKYLSQFETHVTNGSRTAYPGGDRDLWEQMLFGGAYHASDVRYHERPKYGALNLMNHADGASPRFGSCYLRLRPHVWSRCTFTFGDSYTRPECIGTGDVFEPLLARLLQTVEATHVALGSPNVDVPSLLCRLLNLPKVIHKPASGVLGRSLDDYIEVQVHGDINLSADVEAFVADPSFQGTQTGDQLEALCRKYAMSLSWHPGFRLSAESVPDDFRGDAMPPFARRVARFATTPGMLDAATLGRAAAALHYQPEIWHDWGTPDETFQHLKYLWHVLVRFG
jgi:hypothetical protein